jgi:Arc/MetJ-type ribon-helix-helix transcriptional regulator
MRLRSDVMASPLTLRLDEKTRKRIARRKRLSASEVVRQAIELWAERQEPVTSPYEAVRDLIEVGPPRESEGVRAYGATLYQTP